MNTLAKSAVAVITTLAGAAALAWGTWAIHSMNRALVDTPKQIEILREKNESLEERLTAAWGFASSVKSLADTNAANIRTSNELRQFMHLMTAMALFSGNSDASVEDVKEIIRMLKDENTCDHEESVAFMPTISPWGSLPGPETSTEEEPVSAMAEMIIEEPTAEEEPVAEEPVAESAEPRAVQARATRSERLRGKELEDFIEDQVQMQRIAPPASKK